MVIDNVYVLNGFCLDFRLEDCVKDLLCHANSTVGDRKFPTPMDAMNYLAEGHILDKTGCYDPEPEDTARLLRHVVCDSELCSVSENKSTTITANMPFTKPFLNLVL